MKKWLNLIAPIIVLAIMLMMVNDKYQAGSQLVKNYYLLMGALVLVMQGVFSFHYLLFTLLTLALMIVLYICTQLQVVLVLIAYSIVFAIYTYIDSKKQKDIIETVIEEVKEEFENKEESIKDLKEETESTVDTIIEE